MPARLRWRKRHFRDLSYFAAAFAAFFAVGYAHTHWAQLRAALNGFVLFFPIALCFACVLAGAYWRMGWHSFANKFFLGAPRPLRSPWVIDGDTIDDQASGVRYRLANIDAPETESTCYREAERAQLAKWALVRMVRGAHVVVARPTFRIDRYGRRVAFLLIDGKDAGLELMSRGLAVPWRGWRRKWCGPRGGLALIAKTGAMPHTCKTCRAFG